MDTHDLILSGIVFLLLIVLAFLSIVTVRVRRQRIAEYRNLSQSKRLRYLFLKHTGQYFRIPLKTIIDSCKTYAEAAESIPLTPEKSNALIQDIYKNSQLMSIYLNELSELIGFNGNIPDMAKIEVNLAELVMSYRREILHETNRGVVVSIRSNMSPNSKVTLDTPMFHVLMMQLLRICAQHTKEGSITINYNWEREGLRFRIEDTGGGIPEEYKGIIFKSQLPNWRALPIECQLIGASVRTTKALIDAMNGTIEAYSSEEEKGIVIDFWFPCYVRFT